jgi:hypothetical protein
MSTAAAPSQSRWSTMRLKQKSLSRLGHEKVTEDCPMAIPSKPSRFSGLPSIAQKIKAKASALVDRMHREKQRKPAWYSDELNIASSSFVFQRSKSTDTEFRFSDGDSSEMEIVDFDSAQEVKSSPHAFQGMIAPEHDTLPTRPEQTNHCIPVFDEAHEPVQQKTFLFCPPVPVISGHRRIVSTDFSDVSSEASYSSGHRRLEFNLSTGFGNKASYMLPVSDKIVQSMERQQQRLSDTFQCLVLVMDPLLKIFEIITIPNINATTTVGNLISRLPGATSDRRLSRLRFSGICCDGVFLDSGESRNEIILQAQRSKRPLLAVPITSTAQDIMEIANYILRTPHVAKLLKDKLT